MKKEDLIKKVDDFYLEGFKKQVASTPKSFKDYLEAVTITDSERKGNEILIAEGLGDFIREVGDGDFGMGVVKTTGLIAIAPLQLAAIIVASVPKILAAGINAIAFVPSLVSYLIKEAKDKKAAKASAQKLVDWLGQEGNQALVDQIRTNVETLRKYRNVTSKKGMEANKELTKENILLKRNLKKLMYDAGLSRREVVNLNIPGLESVLVGEMAVPATPKHEIDAKQVQSIASEIEAAVDKEITILRKRTDEKDKYTIDIPQHIYVKIKDDRSLRDAVSNEIRTRYKKAGWKSAFIDSSGTDIIVHK